MDGQTDSMVIFCGSETIRIETNYFSDISETSETSSCLSESDYEETEQESHLLYNKADSNVKFKNPYVKLVRCDHLLTNGATVVLTPRLTNSYNKGCRTSLRKRRPNCYYKSDDFCFGKYVNTKTTRTRKKSRPKRKSIVSSSTRRVVSSSRKDVARTVDSSHNGAFNFTVAKRNVVIENRETVNKNDIRLNQKFVLENSEMEKNVYLPHIKEENPELIWQDVAIKSEPFDSYFNNTSDEELNRNRSDILNYVVKKEPNESLQNRTEKKRVLYDEQEFSVKTKEKTYVKMETEAAKENNEESDESELDIETIWDCSEFIASQTDIDFDHCYQLPHYEMRADVTGFVPH